MSRLSELFRWKTKIELKDVFDRPMLDGEKPWVLYLRIVGDNDLSEARNEALKRSRVLRSKLRDFESSEYIANFVGMDSLTKDEMINAIIVSEISDYRDEGLSSIKEEIIPELPDEATLEQQEEYQHKIEEKETKPNEKLLKFIENKGEQRRKELSEKEDLKKMYVDAIINIRCSEEFLDTFRNYCIYKGTYEDEKYKKLAFDSFEDYLSCASQLKNTISQAYVKLELGIDALKN